MRINVDEIHKYLDKHIWVCDTRFNEKSITNKLIRNVRPQEVIVKHKNDTTKSVYYSNYFLRGISKNGKESSKDIMIYDTTGFRSNSGTAVNMFTDKDECITFHNIQINSMIQSYESLKKHIISDIDKKILALKR